MIYQPYFTFFWQPYVVFLFQLILRFKTLFCFFLLVFLLWTIYFQCYFENTFIWNSKGQNFVPPQQDYFKCFKNITLDLIHHLNILKFPFKNKSVDITTRFFKLSFRSSKNNFSFISEVGLFSEVLNFQQNDPSLVERLLMHPLAEGYLQVFILCWLMFIQFLTCYVIISHLIYSI